MRKHTISVMVENQPGVLARVSALFSRRGYNIESLAVGVTQDSDVSIMTVVVRMDDKTLTQLTRQLDKLINVLDIKVLDPAGVVERELLLVKVKADNGTRGNILEVVGLFQGKIVDVSESSLIIEATGSRAKMTALRTMLEPWGIINLIQSGMVAMDRDSITSD